MRDRTARKPDRTADGGLLLVENSWITAAPLTVVPYANFFYGWDRPQSVARAGSLRRNLAQHRNQLRYRRTERLSHAGHDRRRHGRRLDRRRFDRRRLGPSTALGTEFLTPHGRQTPQCPAISTRSVPGINFRFPTHAASFRRHARLARRRRGRVRHADGISLEVLVQLRI